MKSLSDCSKKTQKEKVDTQNTIISERERIADELFNNGWIGLPRHLLNEKL